MKLSTYVSHPVDADGRVHWSAAEDAIWATLVQRQLTESTATACHAYQLGLQRLQLPTERIPQLPELNTTLMAATGWALEPVPALINFDTFFELLARRRFPCATFIRRQEELDYLQEPDIFHEVFGHCPMLTNPHFADFTHRYGLLGQAACHKDRVMLARLYWFTVEFGLIREQGQLRIYGGGILSSIGETRHALHTEGLIRKRLDLVEALRTPYRIDIMQPKYFWIDDLAELATLTNSAILTALAQAKELGLLPALYPAKSTQAHK